MFTSIYNDPIRNAFYELSGLGSLDVSYFVRISLQQHDHGPIRDHLVRLFVYRGREKKTGEIFPAGTVEILFSCFLGLSPKEIQKAKENNTSVLHEMVIAIGAKGRASQEAAGDLHRRNSLAIRRAGGFEELERDRATQRAAGWPTLKRGRDTHKASGWFRLTKGRATKSAMAQDIRDAKFEAWYGRDKCPNGLRYNGDGGPELDSEAWEAYYVQEDIPGIVPMRVNSKQLKTDRYLEEFRAREATATASRQ